MRVQLSNGLYVNVTLHTKKQKMEQLESLSTSKYLNSTCMRLTKKAEVMNKRKGGPKLICGWCFVNALKRFKNVDKAMVHNFNLLTTYSLTKEDINGLGFLHNRKYFRFEAFGELENETQLKNYINIASNYSGCNFALWTKNTLLIHKYLASGGKIPSNLKLVISSTFINVPVNPKLMEILRSFHSDIITFTVTDDKNNPNINCGSKHCIGCLNCYKDGERKDVTELIKGVARKNACKIKR